MQSLFSISFASIFLFVHVLSLSLSPTPNYPPFAFQLPLVAHLACKSICPLSIFSAAKLPTQAHNPFISLQMHHASPDRMISYGFLFCIKYAKLHKLHIDNMRRLLCRLRLFFICRLDKCAPFSSGHSPGRPNDLKENLGTTTQSPTSPWQPPAPGVPGSS